MAKNKIPIYHNNKLMHSAIGFYEQAKKMYGEIDFKNGTNAFQIIPSCIVCFSFTAELLLKANYSLLYGKGINGHDLKDLFDNLKNKPLEEKIEDKFNELNSEGLERLRSILIQNNSDGRLISEKREVLTINQFLELYNRSFIEWRYYFEIDGKEKRIFDFTLMDNFITALRESLIDLIKEKEGA